MNTLMETIYYKVGECVFAVSAEENLTPLMTNYEPFVCDDSEPLFTLNVGGGSGVDYVEETRQKDGDNEIVCGMVDDRPVFEFKVKSKTSGFLICDSDYHCARLVLTDNAKKHALDNSLMILYALATANEGVALFHSAVVSKAGKAYMFLGRSGTGKSTHAKLWLRYVEGTELMNDDNPVVRVDGCGEVTVYGSPWSGKTPCYRNVSASLGGIVLLSQAPYSKIRRLEGVSAYAAVVPSISGKRWDVRVADGLHNTENALAMRVPVWYFECLPDEAAARLCYETVK